MLRASSITHLLNKGINPLTVQQHARHKNFKTSMIYNTPTQQQMKHDIERAFVPKTDLNNKDKVKLIVDKYLSGELTTHEMNQLLEVIRPKELNHKSELTGYI